MTIPAIPVRNVAICVFRHGSRILVAKGVDRIKGETFFRPLGGEVEAGETPAEAVVREIREELGAGVHRLVHLGEIENVFVYEGRPGHERVSVFDGVFEDTALYERESVPMHEAGWDGDALWLDRARSLSGPLYPEGLAALLDGHDEGRSRVAVPLKTVEVVPYDPTWPSEFEQVREELARVMDGATRAIHHIGSTSVPGLSAKPVIDVLVETSDLARIDRASPHLERLGYEARGEYGIPGRRYFSRPAGAALKVHLHCFEVGHDAAACHLRFRDWLRLHADEAARYGDLKRSLAVTYANDRDGYQEAKAGFIEEMLARAPWMTTPPRLADRWADLEWALAYQYVGHSVVYRLSRDGVPQLFLKLAPADHDPSLASEAERMRWAADYLSVPEVVAQGTEGTTAWLATKPLAGRDGTHPDLLARPEELTRALARGLRAFHDQASVERCRFDFRLDAAIRHVRVRLASGRIDSTRDFHPEFRHLTPEEAVALLEATRPASEDLVVCHGDYCPPNILIQDGRATGYLDLGELGVADRWWDLAVATWSMTWNLGAGFEDLFLREYGANPDAERMKFYRLLYDLAC